MKKIESYFLSRYSQEDYLRYNQAKLVLRFCLTTALFSILYAIAANLIAFRESGTIMPIAAIVFFGLAFMLRTFVEFGKGNRPQQGGQISEVGKPSTAKTQSSQRFFYQ